MHSFKTTKSHSTKDFVFVQVAFEYSASELNIVESFWTFTIPEQNITIPFLLVGQAREPDISMDRSHMNFKALLIGKTLIKL